MCCLLQRDLHTRGNHGGSERFLFEPSVIEAKSSRKIGYIRVSTSDQYTDRQVDGLKRLCDRLFIEHGSAVAKTRPQFTKALRQFNKGDTLMVWDLDRAFRSTLDAVTTAEALRQRGVHLQIVTLNIDTATPEGELYYTIIAAFAQFERRMLSRRTKEGMAAARKRGQVLGRPFLMSTKQARTAFNAMEKHNWSLTRTAGQYGISRMALTRAFERAGLPHFSSLSTTTKGTII